jgi:hypothetical protein
MAYVLSHNVVAGSSCNGQRLFKFDPIVFRSNPLWTYKTSSCGHLGLTFGRYEAFFYAYSGYNS